MAEHTTNHAHFVHLWILNTQSESATYKNYSALRKLWDNPADCHLLRDLLVLQNIVGKSEH